MATLGTYIAWFINPKYTGWAELAGLAVPALLIINAGFVLIWLIFYRRYMVLSLVVLALGWWHINALIAFSSDSKPSEEKIRVMSFNVRSFHFPGAYRWHKSPPGIKSIADSIAPDILCMQEYLAGGNWIPKFGFRNKYIPKEEGLTLAIYTNYRIINKGEVSFGVRGDTYGKFIYADVLQNNDTLRVINVHLMSSRLDEEDFRSFTELDMEQLDEDRLAQSSKNIIKRLHDAAPVRGEQASAVSDFIALSPYPVILCGDLNDTPTTYTYRKLTKNLNDTFRQAGNGFGTTHPKFAKYHLPLRIDHILVSTEFKATQWRTFESEFSDHNPVYADLTFR